MRTAARIGEHAAHLRRQVVLDGMGVGEVSVQVSAALLEYAQGLRTTGRDKIFLYFEAFVHESTILSFPAPACIFHPGAILLHDYWAVYDPPSDLPFGCHTPYNISNNNIV